MREPRTWRKKSLPGVLWRSASPSGRSTGAWTFPWNRDWPWRRNSSDASSTRKTRKKVPRPSWKNALPASKGSEVVLVEPILTADRYSDFYSFAILRLRHAGHIHLISPHSLCESPWTMPPALSNRLETISKYCASECWKRLKTE